MINILFIPSIICQVLRRSLVWTRNGARPNRSPSGCHCLLWEKDWKDFIGTCAVVTVDDNVYNYRCGSQLYNYCALQYHNPSVSLRRNRYVESDIFRGDRGSERHTHLNVIRSARMFCPIIPCSLAHSESSRQRLQISQSRWSIFSWLHSGWWPRDKHNWWPLTAPGVVGWVGLMGLCLGLRCGGE